MSLDAPQPSLFVPHGAPTFMLHPGAAGAALSALADTLPAPRAIVMVSAHWETAVPTVGFAPRPVAPSSRISPPEPVAAPGHGEIAVGWL